MVSNLFVGGDGHGLLPGITGYRRRVCAILRLGGSSRLLGAEASYVGGLPLYVWSYNK